MKYFYLLAILVAAACCYSVNVVSGLPLPQNQYAYMQARYEIRRLDTSHRRHRALTDKERMVSLYFEKQKQKEFDETRSFFYPARPIEENLAEITARPLYALLKRMPKGGNMHTHEFQLLDRRLFLQMIIDSPEYDMLYVCDMESHPELCRGYTLMYFKKNPKSGYVKVKGSDKWKRDKLVELTTLSGALNTAQPPIYPTDSVGRWDLSGQINVFNVYSDLTRYNKTRYDYMRAVLQTCKEENVQLMEFRRSMFGNDLYYFNEAGDRVSGDISVDDQIRALIELKNEYIRQNPEFIDFTFLIYSGRSGTKESVRKALNAFVPVQKKYPQLIRGFDLVGEEDAGHTLLFHADALIEGFNASLLSNGTFNYYFHTSETNWPEDMPPSKFGDDVSTLENSYDSLILNTHRIGHGIGYFKHPELYDRLRKKEIAIEACPSSNQILGYVSDLRNHPAINYFRSGIPVVLGGDDPGSFGYNEFTLDFYLAYMAWGLNFADLKQIALNSIHYSTMPAETKKLGFTKFNTQWNTFVDNVFTDACVEQMRAPIVLNITNVLPTIGPYNESNRVTIFGYGFEQFLCFEDDVVCLFDGVESQARVDHVGELTCETPVVANPNLIVPFALRYGEQILNTSFTYHYMTLAELQVPNDDVVVTTPCLSTTTSAAATLVSTSSSLKVFQFAFATLIYALLF